MPAGAEPEPAAENVSRTDGAAPPLEVGIRHASLEHAPYVLVVGHFAGAPLSGSEGRLDDRLGGRLTRLSLLNQYPRNIGEYLLLTLALTELLQTAERKDLDFEHPDATQEVPPRAADGSPTTTRAPAGRRAGIFPGGRRRAPPRVSAVTIGTSSAAV